MPGYPPELTRRQISSPDELAAAWVGDAAPPQTRIEVVDYDPRWPALFAAEAARLGDVLSGVALSIQHVGSTSVPGLAAKPIIDIDILVADSDAEDRYVPPLVDAGYRLVLREPWWNGHRMLVPEGGGVNLHIFPEDAPEPMRHLLFRDWLRSHPDDRELYASAKRELAEETAESPEDYNLAKNAVIDEIFGRIFRMPPEAHPAWRAQR